MSRSIRSNTWKIGTDGIKEKMIAQLRGKIIETNADKDSLRLVLDVQGVGYEVLMAKSSDGRAQIGQSCVIYVSESVTAFDGATTLYGFFSKEEKDLFLRIRENVDGMGPKKALECLEKISKSLPDFKRALIESDLRILVSVFGFTKKTAEKLVFALKGKMDGWVVTGPVRWTDTSATSGEIAALSGLLNIGFNEVEAREILGRAKSALGQAATAEALIKEALKLQGGKI